MTILSTLEKYTHKALDPALLVVNKSLEKGSFDNALIVLGAFGWVVSMLAQVTAIKTNKNIPDDKKKFLIPQETSDGLVNAGLFTIFTSTLTRSAKKAVDSGRLLTDELRDSLKNISIAKGEKLEDIISAVANPGNIHNKLKNIESDVVNFSKSQAEEVLPKFKKFKGGMGMVATLIGSVLACNIATPIARNQIGAHFEKKAKEAEVAKLTPANQPMQLTNTVAKRPVLPSVFSSITKI